MPVRTTSGANDEHLSAAEGVRPPRRRRFVVAGGLLAIAALVALAHAPFARRAVQRFIVARALAAGTDLTLDRIDYNLLTLRVDARGISLAAHGRPPSEPYFRAERASIRFRPSALLGHLRFSAVEVVRPSIEVRRMPDGRFNLPAGDGTSKRLPRIDIDRLVIDRLDAGLLDARGLSFVVRGASIDMRPGAAHIRGRLVSGAPGWLRAAENGEVPLLVDGEIGYAPGRLVLQPLNVRLGTSTIRADGSLAFDGAPARVDIKLQGDVGLDVAARLRRGLAPAQGRLLVNGRVAGPLSQPELLFEARGARLNLAGITIERASSRGRLDASGLTLDPIEIDVARGRIAGTLSMRGPATQVRAGWNSIDVAALLANLGVAASAALPAASISGSATAGWEARRIDSLSVEARAHAATTALARDGQLAADLTLRLDASRWSLDVARPHGETGALTGALQGRLAAGAFRDTTLGGRLDISASVADVLAWTPRDQTAAQFLARAHGLANARLDVAGTLGAPRCAVALAMPDLRVDGVGAGTLDSAVELDERRATIQRLAVVLGRNTVEADGVVPFHHDPIDVRFSGGFDDLHAIAPTSADRWMPDGRLIVSGRVTGRPQSVVVDGELRSDDLSWNGFRAGPVEGTAGLADGRVSLALDVPALRAALAASMQLSRPRPYEMSARLRGSDLARLADLAQRLGAPRLALSGVANADLLAAGTADGSNPSIEARVESLDGEYEGLPLRLSAPTRIVLSTDSLALDPTRAQLGGATIEAGGSLGTRGSSLRASVDVTVDQWLPWLRRATHTPGLRATGRLHADLAASGSLREPLIAGSLALSDASATGEFGAVTDANARLVLEHGLLQLTDARAAWSNAPAQASGSVPLAMLRKWLPDFLTRQPGQAGGQNAQLQSGLHLRASIASLDSAALAPWLSADTRARLEGRVGASVEIDASELTLAAARGNASVTVADLAVNGIALTASAPARMRLESGRLVLEPTSLLTRGEGITVGGAIDFNKNDPALDLGASGSIDLAIAREFLPVAISGIGKADVRLTGDISRPRLTGTVTLADAGIGIAVPRIALSGLNGRLALAGDSLTVEATGSANGGNLRLDGRVALDAAGRPGGLLRLVGKDAALEWPEGLRSTFDLDVTYSLDAGTGVIAGRVTAEPGAYRRAAVPNFSIRLSKDAAAPAPSSLDATKLNLAISTRSPGLVDNSFAEIEVDADLRVTGTIGEPAVGGSLTARDGGKVSFRCNNFVIDRGVLLFDPKTGARPSLDMTARSRRSGYNIRLAASGPSDNLRLDLSSDPPLAQSDLMSLITTGSVSNSMSGTSAPSGGTSASQDALVAGISSDILGLAGSSIGLDTVRVGQLDLDLLGQDVDPETRLTIGKSIGTRVDVLLSQNLRDSGLTWIITVRPAGKWEISYVSRDSESTTLQVRHEVTFGGAARPPSPPPATAPRKRDLPKIARVMVSGEGANDGWLAKNSLHAGDRFDFFEWQRDRERMEQALHDAGFLEARVAARRVIDEETPGSVTLDYGVTRGPKTILQVQGFSLPEQAMSGMRAAWSLSVDETRLLADLRERAASALMDEGYLGATVRAERPAISGAGEKTIVVAIAPGIRVTRRRLVFQGNNAVTSAALQAEVEQHRLEVAAWRNPAVLAPVLTDFYQSQGYSSVRVTPGRVTLDRDSAELAVTIVEGPIHRVVSVSVVGADAVQERNVVEWAGVRAGDHFDARSLEQIVQRIRKGFERDGYLDASATVTPRVEAETGRVELIAKVSPGTRSVITEVQLVGRGITRESIVERAMRLPPGTPAAPASIDAAQRRLYETDAFQSVKIDVQPVPAAGQDSPGPADVRPVQATVTLQEAPLYRARYGVQFGSELDDVSREWTNNPGFAVGLRRRNVFGTAFGAAVGLWANLHKQSVRGAITIPSSVFWPAISTLFVTRTRTVSGSDGHVTENELQVTYQDRWRLGRRVEWTYGYSLTGSDRQENGPQTYGVEEQTVNGTRAAVYTAVVRDTRDSPFNATRGTLHSMSIEHGGSGLGSDIGYMRYLFQGSYYLKAGPLVFAGATRVGAATHLTGDNQLSYDIRFRTGGDREVRGYAEQSLHPPEVQGQPVGGEALLLLNGEVRFPIAGWLKAATFVDAGNAFTNLGAVSFRNLKVGMGLGIRLDTKYALFRVDFGMPVPREPGGPFGRWYFSVGQAF